MQQVYVAYHARGPALDTYVFAATGSDFTVADFAQYLGNQYEPDLGHTIEVELQPIIDPLKALEAAATPAPAVAENAPPAPGKLPAGDYTVYADGSCLGNPGAGGIGFVVLRDGASVFEQCQAWTAITTNQAMELAAAEAALTAITDGSLVTIRTDSQYVIGLMTSNWKVKANHDRVSALRAAVGRHRAVRWEHVRGHKDDRWNIAADRLARTGSSQAKARLSEARRA